MSSSNISAGSTQHHSVNYSNSYIKDLLFEWLRRTKHVWGWYVSEVEPMHAIGIFSVSRRLEVYQTIIFEYLDLDRYFTSIIDNFSRLEKELSILAHNMQVFLDKEEIVINGERVRPRVIGVDIGFKGEPEEPYVAYFIFFKGKPVKGMNYYENIYEEEVAEYPFSVYWYFPPSAKIIEVEASGETEIVGDNILIIRVNEGNKISGYEKIVFEIR